MKYRKLTADGDYSFGQGLSDFYIDQVEAVAQAALTRLQLYTDSFWRDLDDGLPMFQSILGTPGSQENLLAIDSIITNRIRQTTGVTSIIGYNSNFNATTRRYEYEATIQTAYSTTVITGTL